MDYGLWITNQKKIDLIIHEMEAHIAESNQGEILREGFRIVIIGEPNVGKSSLINLLAKRDVAIVSDIAGTTRDAIEVNLNIAGFPVIITDTAGLRESKDEIEKLGIDLAYSKIKESNAIIEIFTNPEKVNLKEFIPPYTLLYWSCFPTFLFKSCISISHAFSANS